MPHIWLIGGTSESRTIAQALVAQQIPCVVTVTTPPARQLYPVAEGLTVQVGALTPELFPDFVAQYRVKAIVDASHPHAVEISRHAIQFAEAWPLPYLRYERSHVISNSHHVITLPDWETLLQGDYLNGQRVLLIVGYRRLAQFTPWHDRATLFTRILPSPTALNAALAAGFDSRQIIALRPPISLELEAALWQQWQISRVVAKTSGTAGGTDIKQQVAAQLRIPLLLIDRPPLAYPQQTQDVPTIVEFCHLHLNSSYG
ncbi:MAG: cobalt-precorrin-6A reductase [Spirulina sp. SIO3F2]|nr:cobalt-precorrin-6A reductase [Spirulina sp. SIO3F2]